MRGASRGGTDAKDWGWRDNVLEGLGLHKVFDLAAAWLWCRWTGRRDAQHRAFERSVVRRRWSSNRRRRCRRGGGGSDEGWQKEAARCQRRLDGGAVGRIKSRLAQRGIPTDCTADCIHNQHASEGPCGVCIRLRRRLRSRGWSSSEQKAIKFLSTTCPLHIYYLKHFAQYVMLSLS